MLEGEIEGTGCGQLIACRRVVEPFSRPSALVQLLLHGSKCPGYYFCAGIEDLPANLGKSSAKQT